MKDFLIGTGVPFAYYLTAFAFIVMAISFLLGTVLNIKKSWSFVAGMLLLLVVFGIMYSTGSDAYPAEVTDKLISETGLTPNVMKFVSAGTLIAVGLTVAAFIFMVIDMIMGLVR